MTRRYRATSVGLCSFETNVIRAVLTNVVTAPLLKASDAASAHSAVKSAGMSPWNTSGKKSAVPVSTALSFERDHVSMPVSNQPTN